MKKMRIQYPNPVKNELFIEFNQSITEAATFELINATGKTLIKSKLTNKNMIQTGNLSQGIYLVKIVYGMKTEYQKIIKQ